MSRRSSPPGRRPLFEELVARERPQILHLAGQLGELVSGLDAYGLPATIDHSDLHAWNVLAPGDRYVVFDWHEAAVSHPFFSMVVATRSLVHSHGVEPGSAAYRRLVDAYLEPWTIHASRADLWAALDLALRVGPLTRVLGWDRVLRGMPAAAAGEWADSLSGWLEELGTELDRP
jgi:Ser/Thr protein kinase RdoA (MazF antagonist)